MITYTYYIEYKRMLIYLAIIFTRTGCGCPTRKTFFNEKPIKPTATIINSVIVVSPLFDCLLF